MSAKKTEKEESPETESAEGLPMQERIAELEAKIRAGEEAALERVCKALGVTTSEVQAKEAAALAEKKPEPMIKMWVRFPVRVNSKTYSGSVTVPYSLAQVLHQAMGDRQMRLLRELTGNNYILKEIMGEGFCPTLVGQVGMDGAQISVQGAS